MRLTAQMKAAINIGTNLLIIGGNSVRRTRSAIAEIAKHKDVVNLMGSHNGIMLLKSVMLNTQPAISRKLIINTKDRDINKIVPSDPDGSDDCRFRNDIYSEE
jgi:hypothetical protein